MKTPKLFTLVLFSLAASWALPFMAQNPEAMAQNPEAAAANSALASAPATARIVYTFSHPQLQPAQYTLSVDETGKGRFTSTPGNQPADASDGVFPAPIDREIRLDEPMLAELFRYARAHSYFGSSCERTQGKLAFTGNKTLSYTGTDGHGSCSFIWAADPALQNLSDQLEAVAFTLEVGRRLDVEVRHDRLSLDAELQSLQDAVQSRRASGLPNIAPQLQTIAEDQDVMERARRRALALLSRCETAQKSN